MCIALRGPYAPPTVSRGLQPGSNIVRIHLLKMATKVAVATPLLQTDPWLKMEQQQYGKSRYVNVIICLIGRHQIRQVFLLVRNVNSALITSFLLGLISSSRSYFDVIKYDCE